MSKAPVAPHLRVDYDHFREQSDPFNLMDEIAQIRTLFLEVRENLEASAVEKVTQFADLLEGLFLKDELEDGADQDEAVEKAQKVHNHAIRAYQTCFGSKPRLTPKDALDMVKAVELLSKISERYKKMVDGIMLEVAYDARVCQFIQFFIQRVVIKYVAKGSRMELANECFQFIPNIRALGGLPALTGEVIDVEATPMDFDDDNIVLDEEDYV